jgi:hypothetical protein
MKGGELINQGSYGCIYKPGLKCNVEKEEKREGELTKLQILNEFSIKEMEIGKKIMEEYPKDYMEDFSPIIESCVDIDVKEIETDIKSCEALRGEREKIVLNRMKDEGKETLSEVLINTKSKKISVRQYFYTLLKVLESVERLNKIGIIHLDIKGNNIMYNERMGRPKIIDFGLSLDIEKIEEQEKDVFFTYAYDYEPWCIDLTIITYIIKKKKKEEKIEEGEIMKVIEDYVRNNSNVLEEKKEGYEEELKEYFKKSIGKTYGELYKELLKNAKTWDGISILIMYNYLLMHITGIRENEELKKMGTIKGYVEWLEENMYKMPNERKELGELRGELSKIIIKMLRNEMTKNIKKDKEMYMKDMERVEKTKERLVSVR